MRPGDGRESGYIEDRRSVRDGLPGDWRDAGHRADGHCRGGRTVRCNTLPSRAPPRPEARLDQSADPHDHLADMRLALLVRERGTRFVESEDAVDHRLDLVQRDDPVHGFEHFA